MNYFSEFATAEGYIDLKSLTEMWKNNGINDPNIVFDVSLNLIKKYNN